MFATAVSDGQVFVPVDNFLYALDASTGAVRWVSQLGDETGVVYGGGAAVHKGMAYVATTNGDLFALDAGTGALRWTQPTGEDIDSVPAVDKKTVYIGSIDSHVHAFNARTGAVLWSEDRQGTFTDMGSAAVVNGLLYMPFGGSGLVAFGLP